MPRCTSSATVRRNDIGPRARHARAHRGRTRLRHRRLRPADRRARPNSSQNAPDLAAFLRVAVDIRNIDVAAASAHGILVTQASPGFAASVAEMAIGFMIDCGRHVSEAAETYHAGRVPQARMGRQLKGATVGIIGYGVIGEYLADLALAFGMTVLVADPYKKVVATGLTQVALPDLLARSDFVVCLAVADEATENLMNAAAFAAMKPSAYFINLSRGNLVDEAALAEALDAKRIAGAALDVGRAADQMPTASLARRADVIATPHIAGLTPDAAEHQAFDTVRQIEALIAGRMPEGAVNAANRSPPAPLRARLKKTPALRPGSFVCRLPNPAR